MAGKKNFADIGGVVEELIGGAQPQQQQQPEGQQQARQTEAAYKRLSFTEAERAKMEKQARANAALMAKRGNWRRERPNYGETRSHRTQLLVKPSIFDALQEIALRDNISFNQIAERSFLEYIEKHADRQE